jgi:hypothetical protein
MDLNKQICQWIQTNPTKDVFVNPISIVIFSDTDDKKETPIVGPGGLSVVPLDPPGPVSLYLWHTNPEYRAGNFTTRKHILRETIIMLNEKFATELKGRQWNRKKVIEQLQEQESSAVSPPMNTPDLSKALCYVLGFQYAEVDEVHKKIFWYPEDIRTWSNEFPIYLVSHGCRSIYVKKDHEEARPFFKSWLFDLENKNYICIWPITDGSMKEIKEKLESFHLTFDKQFKKEHHSIILGKAEALRHISREF